MKILLLFIAPLWCFQAQAQLRIGVQGGYNSTTLSPNNAASDLFSYSTAAIGEFNAGIVAEMRLADNWMFRPGILINGKGTRLKKIKTGWNDTSSRIIELHYIEIPLNIIHNWKAGKKSSAFVGAGLYVGRAFRGVEQGEGRRDTDSYYLWKRIEFKSHNTGQGLPTIVNRMDYGVNFIAGVERHGIQLIVSYSQGLHRVFPESLVFEDKFTTSVLSFSAAYFIKTKKK